MKNISEKLEQKAFEYFRIRKTAKYIPCKVLKERKKNERER